jgi:hypothetical protein
MQQQRLGRYIFPDITERIAGPPASGLLQIRRSEAFPIQGHLNHIHGARSQAGATIIIIESPVRNRHTAR